PANWATPSARMRLANRFGSWRSTRTSSKAGHVCDVRNHAVVPDVVVSGTHVFSPGEDKAMKVFSHIEQRARQDARHIVLVEGEDPRIIEGACKATLAGVATVTVLGDPDRVHAQAAELNLNPAGLNIIDPESASITVQYAHVLHELRHHKGMTGDQANALIRQPLYCGDMMVRLGADD